MDKVMILQDRN